MSRHAPQTLVLIGVVALIGLAGRSVYSASQHQDVRYLPTPQNVVDAMLTLARVTPSDVVFDLGSGDGRIPITAARKFGARGVGVEIDPALVRLARDTAARQGVSDRVTFIEGDLFQADISSATVVALFLLPSMNMRLIPKFQHDLRPGARIVSHHFLMGDQWPPDAEQDVSGLMIYLWKIGQ